MGNEQSSVFNLIIPAMNNLGWITYVNEVFSPVIGLLTVYYITTKIIPKSTHDNTLFQEKKSKMADNIQGPIFKQN